MPQVHISLIIAGGYSILFNGEVFEAETILLSTLQVLKQAIDQMPGVEYPDESLTT